MRAKLMRATVNYIRGAILKETNIKLIDQGDTLNSSKVTTTPSSFNWKADQENIKEYKGLEIAEKYKNNILNGMAIDIAKTENPMYFSIENSDANKDANEDANEYEERYKALYPDLLNGDTKMYATPKSLQDKVFEEIKKTLPRELLRPFLLAEPFIRKSSMSVFETSFSLRAGPQGVPETAVAPIIRNCGLMFAALILLTLYETYKSITKEINDSDNIAYNNFLETQFIYNEALPLLKDIFRQLELQNEFKKNKEFSQQLLTLLNKCAKDENNDVIWSELRNMAQSFLNNKPLERVRQDNKIQQTLQHLEKQGNPLASKLLEIVEIRGFKNTKTKLENKIEKMDQKIKESEKIAQGLEEQFNNKLARIANKIAETEKEQEKMKKNLLIQCGFKEAKSLDPKILAQCNEIKEMLKANKTDQEEKPNNSLKV
ncbi:hypothetical protein Lgra_1686 [Legionella gratiana]|uniref:Uncharacterized protein n=1 Tax=Legionella gratiana TaxID=45066 RepID=A0A378J8V7_9GAMM|nr:hypothetical protein [Legionella gratiana]KTD10720.1 hypothetical protein Lgra_1686 [Legionella gratiana]STX43796.1 Uncharacterised protein [Legionella gratiana]